MAISRIKQIKRILKEHDVRDPRGALEAIENVLKQAKEPKAKLPDPVLTLTLTRTGKSTLACIIKSDHEVLKPQHILAAMESLDEFGSEKFGKDCDDPDCPVHGTDAKPNQAVASTLGELFAQLESESKKGNLQ